MNFTNKTIATKVKTTFLALILTLNKFLFNSKNFLQTKGVQWELFMHDLTQIHSWNILS